MEIRRENFGGAGPQALADALETELLSTYEGEPGSGPKPSPADFEPPAGVFLVAWEDGVPLACGGLSRYDETTAELRRMYVSPAARGRGLGRALLEALELEARTLGYAFLRLETGNLQTAAIGLYVAAGYLPIPRYGPFANDPKSVCFEKRLES
jgi:GNAT superfamily N-acetyltransferase